VLNVHMFVNRECKIFKSETVVFGVFDLQFMGDCVVQQVHSGFPLPSPHV